MMFYRSKTERVWWSVSVMARDSVRPVRSRRSGRLAPLALPPPLRVARAPTRCSWWRVWLRRTR